MQDHVVSVRVSLVVVVMAVVLMCSTALAGERFTLRPSYDQQKGWPMPSSGDHWSRVDDADGWKGWRVDTAGIGVNVNDPRTEVFGLTNPTRPRAISFWCLKGVMNARGRHDITGTGKIRVWVKKGGQQLYMGEYKVTATAGEFEPLQSGLVYSDWTQAEIYDAKITLVGWRPEYPDPYEPTGSTHLEEVRLYFYCQ